MKQRASSFIRDGIKNFHPAYFAMVMATGIVSVAFKAMVFPDIAEILFVLNLIFYPILCFMLIIRMLRFGQSLLADLSILRRTWLFLTFVVGTNTVGMQLVIFLQASGLAGVLWLVGAGWLARMHWFYYLSISPMRRKARRGFHKWRDAADGCQHSIRIIAGNPPAGFNRHRRPLRLLRNMGFLGHRLHPVSFHCAMDHLPVVFLPLSKKRLGCALLDLHGRASNHHPHRFRIRHGYACRIA